MRDRRNIDALKSEIDKNFEASIEQRAQEVFQQTSAEAAAAQVEGQLAQMATDYMLDCQKLETAEALPIRGIDLFLPWRRQKAHRALERRVQQTQMEPYPDIHIQKSSEQGEYNVDLVEFLSERTESMSQDSAERAWTIVTNFRDKPKISASKFLLKDDDVYFESGTKFASCWSVTTGYFGFRNTPYNYNRIVTKHFWQIEIARCTSTPDLPGQIRSTNMYHLILNDDKSFQSLAAYDREREEVDDLLLLSNGCFDEAITILQTARQEIAQDLAILQK